MTFPIEEVRAQFPALDVRDGGRPRVYLDNPAGTQVPRAVADAAYRYLLESNANLGGFFATSLASEGVAQRSHEALARFVGAESYREVVIGPSMTALTFALSRSLGRMLNPGDEIVVTHMDHDGNIAPWLALAEDRGLTVRWVRFDPRTWVIEVDAFETALSDRTRVVALNYANNLTGSVNDVGPLIERAHRAGALVCLDAVQYAPHRAIDVAAIGCDFLTCSPYKFFGPHMGVLWGREALLAELYPYKVRPQTADLPWKLETGTPQLEQLAALEATVAYFEDLGARFTGSAGGRARILAAYGAIEPWERTLTERLLAGLKRIAGVRIVGIDDPARFDSRVPTVSFVHESRASSEIARNLARRNVFVWSGHNFALETVRQLEMDEREGVVRVGPAHYNTPHEIDAALDAIACAVAGARGDLERPLPGVPIR